MNASTLEARLTPAEEAFEKWRRRAGLFLAPLAFLILWFLPIDGLEPKAHRLLAVMGVAVVLWMTEALPMGATALVTPALTVLVGVTSAKEAYRPFADPIIFLFVGSFMLVEAMMRHGLNRRIAFGILRLPWVGDRPFGLYAAFGVVVTFVSMWVSNAATTAMMLPIGIAIASEVARAESARTGREIHFTALPLATGLMLLTAFGASVGGLATPIGTPPNLIGIGLIERTLGTRIGFFDWMRVGLPVAIVLGGFLVLNFHRRCPVGAPELRGCSGWIAREAAGLGAWSRAEVAVSCVFGVAVAGWLFPGVVALWQGPESPLARLLAERMPESIVSLLAAGALFAFPTSWREGRFVLEWKDAVRIDWGTIFLFAGGMALGEQMFSTGLARWIGDGVAGFFQARTEAGLVFLFTGIAVVVSEATSNTASATMIVPIAIAVAQSAGVEPMKPALAACLGSSMGFLMPVSTGPNAMVYGTGCVPLPRMFKHGLGLDVVGYLVIVAAVLVLA
ncbi:MAG: Na(+)/dicarboxylate symporter [Verrucomicrobiota bacterium]